VQVCPSCGEENPDKFRLCGYCGTPLGAVGVGPAPEVRKTVTIVFSDLKGSTDLGERLDSESLRAVMTQYFDEMRRVLERHGGTVEKFIGDAVMAVFGLPTLHEDDALRAVRAASDMKEALHRLNRELERRWDVRLANRTGVNTGEVVAGDPFAGQRLVTGDAVNVAARLEQAAPENEVLIGEPTYDLVRAAVAVEPIAPLELKGKSERVPAYRLISVRSGSMLIRRLDAPLVAREAEMAALQDAFADARATGSARLVTVLAQAGVGKSRLIAEFERETEPMASVLQGSCLPYGEGITFWPMAEVVRAAAAIVEDDSPESAVAKIAAAAGEEQVTERLASLMALSDRDFPVEELFWAARKLLERLAGEGGAVVVFEDVHWAAETFLTLVEHLVDAAQAPILIVCTARPDLLESHPAWSQGPASVRVLLHALSAEDAGAVAANLLGGNLDEAARDRIADAADGNPLFVEQMVSMLIDSGVLRRQDEGWAGAADLSEIHMPPTIQALLAARLDRLGRAERSVIEPASVVGRIFYRGAVEFMATEEIRTAVDELLGALIRKEFVAPHDADTTVVGEDAFRFHHALIRDAAYQALLKRARADLHERFVDWVTNALGARAHEFEEIIGYHLEQAFRYREELRELDDHAHIVGVRASGMLGTAGRRALARGDMPAAANLLRRAAGLLPRTDPRRLQLLPDLGEVLLEQGEFADAEALLSEAILEAARSGDKRLQTEATLVRLAVRFAIDPDGQGPKVVKDVERAIRDSEQLGDHRGQAKAYRMLGTIHGTVARYGDAEQAALRTIEQARLAGDIMLQVRNFPPYAITALYGPLPVPDAIRRCEELLPAAHGDRRTEGVVRCVLGHLFALQGSFADARDQYERARAMLEDLGVKVLAASTSIDSGPIEMLAGEPDAAERELRRDMERLDAMGEKFLLSTVYAYLGQAVLAQGRLDEAEELSRTCEQVALVDDAEAQSIWRRVRAQAIAPRGEETKAISLAEDAVVIIRKTDSPLLKGDALRDLAEVFRLSGRPDDGVGPLREALDLYQAKGNTIGAERARLALVAAGA
jgi:class 3 adenylate cyclase/tetratricopeptide (TPR) repeat protein